MATSTIRAPRKTLTLPKTAANTRAALKAGEKEVPRHDAPKPPSNSMWVHALQDAGGFHRDALQLELAVGLSLFASKADAAKATLEAKKALREVYAEAGYACATPQGADYKTVMRRINVSADLYQYLGGRETVTDWVEDAQPRVQIARIVEKLKEFNFDGINSVLAHMGKAVAVKRPREGTTEPSGVASGGTGTTAQPSEKDKMVMAYVQERLKEEASLPPERVFNHGKVHCAIPVDATYDDVMAMVADLTIFAATKLKVATPVAAPAAVTA